MKDLFVIGFGPLNANCYVLANGKRAVIIDLPNKAGKVVADFCQKRDLLPEAILLTHGHFDHCGGVAEFLKTFDVPVYCHKNDETLAANASQNRHRFEADDCKVDEYVEDGQVLDLCGLKISVMHTPGHTPGSVCYLVDDLMFSGDTLFHGTIGRTDFEESCPEEMGASLQKIKNLQKNYVVYPGHEENTTLDEEKQFNPYLR